MSPIVAQADSVAKFEITAKKIIDVKNFLFDIATMVMAHAATTAMATYTFVNIKGSAKERAKTVNKGKIFAKGEGFLISSSA